MHLVVGNERLLAASIARIDLARDLAHGSRQ
jgi:hypothetical protein